MLNTSYQIAKDMFVIANNCNSKTSLLQMALSLLLINLATIGSPVGCETPLKNIMLIPSMQKLPKDAHLRPKQRPN